MASLLKSRKFQRLFVQSAFVAIIAFVVIFMATIGLRNIEAQGMASGFGFLDRSTGWAMSFSLVETSPRSTYLWFLFAGLINTLFVGCTILIAATLIGVVVAFLRISDNLLARLVGTSYVETCRNIPAILQVVFWYAILTHMPSPRDAYSLWDVAFFTNRGLMLPLPVFSLLDLGLIILTLAALATILIFKRQHPRLRDYIKLSGIAFIVLVLVLWLTGRTADAPLISVPELAGLRFKGGFSVKPEFLGLVIGLSVFGGAYIAEIVRGGLLSVDRGRLEAGAALGLKPWQVNRLIRIPLAIRAIMPALSNQYIWLMKGTTLGIVIGFSDFFGIISTSINQSGQTLELILLLMLGFILINYSLGFILNRLNDRLKLKGRS
ncbi:ABC transporter permease subunit [uncultured Cohaesibacter sp.]|uniref:ABC transporter permease subunit n=1 Tax=uncultured Cohaesibacter sp. TaxID=1002546 RepID=UPI0029C7607A|nr:ABC transporter permease subunit [uncultured Cohaesibacter sp.]